MKATFYGQFVAGQDVETIKPTAEHNRRFGVKSILDYSVEKDISKEEAQDAEMEWVRDCIISLLLFGQDDISDKDIG